MQNANKTMIEIKTRVHLQQVEEYVTCGSTVTTGIF